MESKFILLLVICALSSACEQQKKPVFDPIAEEATIRAILDAEQIAWNNGDLEAFMEGYWKSDSLQFMSPRGANRGWQRVLDEYKTAYPDRAAMGTLSYEVLEVSPLSETNFVVAVRFHLNRTTGPLDGLITLIFKKVGGRWVAVYDHTS